MTKRVPWSQEELLLAFRLYCRTPFGKLHQHNPDIISLAKLLGRTPSAIAMKAINFASLDPAQQARKISGLGNTSRADRDLWDRFQNNAEAVAAQAEAVYIRLADREEPPADSEPDFQPPVGQTEVLRQVRTRRVQSFFRTAVMASYDYRCALSDIAIPELLNASHIIPWSQNIARRADPSNGIALNVLYDRAFDRGLITFDPHLRVVVSKRLKDHPIPEFQRQALVELEGRQLRRPTRFSPDLKALEHHRDRLFVA